MADDGSLSIGKREQTKVQNRQAILDAAREVFGELGYDASTVRDIIRRTGLAAGTFVASRPSSRPAAPRRSDPVHTEDV